VSGAVSRGLTNAVNTETNGKSQGGEAVMAQENRSSATGPMLGASGLSHSTSRGSPFPPIADYGFLSDCEVSVLVAPSGSVEWMCLPRIDGRAYSQRYSIGTPAGSVWGRGCHRPGRPVLSGRYDGVGDDLGYPDRLGRGATNAQGRAPIARRRPITRRRGCCCARR
jgi:hypothetical protein